MPGMVCIRGNDSIEDHYMVLIIGIFIPGIWGFGAIQDYVPLKNRRYSKVYTVNRTFRFISIASFSYSLGVPLLHWI